MAFMLAFGMFMVVTPTQAHACGYGSGCTTSQYNTYAYNSYDNDSYRYNSGCNRFGSCNGGYNPAPQPYYPPQQQMTISCTASPSSVYTGDSVTWSAYVTGGYGSYQYAWSGTDGLSGYGSSISKAYYNSGYKTATVVVTSSNGQTVSRTCDGSVNVMNTYYNNNNNYNYNNYNYYQPLAVSCNSNSVSGVAGSSVTWSAYATGGNGYYTYTWSGSDGLYGSGQSVYTTYTNPGQKYATVTVYSNGQSITQSCGVGINIFYTNSYQPVVYQNQSNQGLNIGCYSDPVTIRVNQPITWLAEADGGIAPYTYSWTGSDGLTGSGQSVIKTYSTTGEKNAIVTVTSADGKTGSRTCTNTLAVRGTGTGSNLASTNTTSSTVSTNTTTGNSLSAASLFSLGNVPWGWIAILIILLLFATVLYLVFNKPKI